MKPQPARLALLAAAVLAPGLALAYDDDTHFYWTYYLARQAGFTKENALRVASADVGIDYDPRTEPIQGYRPVGEATDIREIFHAFLNYTISPRAKAVAQQDSRDAQLKAKAFAAGNPGMYLHYRQDKFAHYGYSSSAGHATAGHTVDYLANSVSRAQQMTVDTMNVLRRFLIAHGGAPAADPMLDAEKRRQLFAALAKVSAANPVSFGSSPDSAKARSVLVALSGENDFPELKNRIVYTFDSKGTVTTPNYALTRPYFGG